MPYLPPEYGGMIACVRRDGSQPDGRSRPMDDLTLLTIAEAADRIARREVSPLELTEAYLDRIERLNPSLNAYVLLTGEQALVDARARTDEAARGLTHGPLHGIP